MINEVNRHTADVKDELIKLSEYIFDNPELGNEEVKACKAHVELLKKHGFEVKEEYLGIKTAFKAVFDSGKDGANICFLAEYDALPGIGHGCGHNILGTTSTGAGIVLSKLIKDLKGKVMVIGTPAEETNGAKVEMTDKGAFDGMDVAMAVHPADGHYKSGSSLAMEAIQFTFKGQSAHAAASPEKGINALDAAINTFVNINALREHIKSSARVHGIIKEGGKAANIVPDLAIAQFYVRAETKTYLKELVAKVKNCAKGAALAAGAELEITNYEESYDNLVTNQKLLEVYCRRLMDMNVDEIHEAKQSYGSLDMGNVSHVIPTIHPYFEICDEEIAGHTKEFAEATKTERAYNSMEQTIGALVLTAIDILQDDNLLAEIWKEFKETEK
ncbi:M20 family metallopeptidase [Wukongibacter baidiensis]|uniref:M20 family metallopeptidase n=1 Tax=Wukongibacter baidiensis TaxID=1723361 RepID=UPI003D7F22F2